MEQETLKRHKWTLVGKKTEKRHRTDICLDCGCERKYYKKYKYRKNGKVTIKPPSCESQIIN